MENPFFQQYELIREARAAVFRFLAASVKEDIFRPVPAFNNTTIAATMIHIVNTYLSWIELFTFKKETAFFDAKDIDSISQLQKSFTAADIAIQQWLEVYAATPAEQVNGYKPGNRYVATTALAVFTHVVTHEFHHKGQVMTMCRLLGHTPPDTDIIRF